MMSWTVHKVDYFVPDSSNMLHVIYWLVLGMM